MIRHYVIHPPLKDTPLCDTPTIIVVSDPLSRKHHVLPIGLVIQGSKT